MGSSSAHSGKAFRRLRVVWSDAGVGPVL